MWFYVDQTAYFLKCFVRSAILDRGLGAAKELDEKANANLAALYKRLESAQVKSSIPIWRIPVPIGAIRKRQSRRVRCMSKPFEPKKLE